MLDVSLWPLKEVKNIHETQRKPAPQKTTNVRVIVPNLIIKSSVSWDLGYHNAIVRLNIKMRPTFFNERLKVLMIQTHTVQKSYL